jgi:hypothetical protein
MTNRLHWAAGLHYAKTRWNRLHGYRQIPALLQALQQACRSTAPAKLQAA